MVKKKWYETSEPDSNGKKPSGFPGAKQMATVETRDLDRERDLCVQVVVSPKTWSMRQKLLRPWSM